MRLVPRARHHPRGLRVNAADAFVFVTPEYMVKAAAAMLDELVLTEAMLAPRRAAIREAEAA